MLQHSGRQRCCPQTKGLGDAGSLFQKIDSVPLISGGIRRVTGELRVVSQITSFYEH